MGSISASQFKYRYVGRQGFGDEKLATFEEILAFLHKNSNSYTETEIFTHECAVILVKIMQTWLRE